MKTMKKIITASIALLLFSAVTVLAQQAPAPAAKEPEYVSEKGFKGKVFEIKNREPYSLYRAIYTLGSGFKGAQMSYSNEDKLIVVRDFPENIAVIEEAIKRLDVPQPPSPPKQNIELVAHILLASQTANQSNDYPVELKDVVKQLQTTFNYKSYFLLTSIVQRTRDGGAINGGGITKVVPPLAKSEVDVSYSFVSNRIFIEKTSGPPVISINNLSFILNSQNRDSVSEAIGKAAINSDFNLREGEKVVVGTASLKDKALVLVVTAKVVK